MAEKLAFGFAGRNWETVVIFPDEEMYRLVKDSKPHLVLIAGLDQTEWNSCRRDQGQFTVGNTGGQSCCISSFCTEDEREVKNVPNWEKKLNSIAIILLAVAHILHVLLSRGR